MAISPSSISTRLPRTLRAVSVKQNKKALALRLIDSGIITILACFLICFSLWAVKTTGKTVDVFGSASSSIYETAEAETPAPH